MQTVHTYMLHKNMHPFMILFHGDSGNRKNPRCHNLGRAGRRTTCHNVKYFILFNLTTFFSDLNFPKLSSPGIFKTKKN